MGEPRQRPPYPIQKGIDGKPTAINNVETWANIPVVIRQGATEFAKVGTKNNSGTKIFSLVGKIKNTGLVEVPIGMITLTINGLDVSVEEGSTILETAQFLGFPIPTLCHMEGLTPCGACRLCVVEIGEGPRARLVTSCTYPAEQGLKVRTASSRVLRARRTVLELLLASCPQSKTIQDLASVHEIRQQRFRQEHEDCILCGRCVRMCEEQMMAKAIGFRGRGAKRSLGTPFDAKSEVCRQCGGCIYVCPACELRCTYTEPDKAICGGCANLAPPCAAKETFDDMMCYMDPCVACEISTCSTEDGGASEQ